MTSEKQKRFSDYLECLPSASFQIIYGAQIFALLKATGELQSMDWVFIVLLWVVGVAMYLLRAAFHQAADRKDDLDGLKTR